jgi:UDPglucose 6-dehydrogenase
VYGLWHLGSVTAACLADAGFMTVGLEDDPIAAKSLADGEPPLFESGLEDLFQSGLASGKLSFTADAKAAVGGAEVVWITFDTPVDDEDQADVPYVMARVTSLFPHLQDGALVLVSSQMPVGSLRQLEEAFVPVANGRRIIFAYSPENLRLGKAIQIFRHPERVIVGVRGDEGKAILTALFAPFSDAIIWTGIEAAELSKHAINAFLATCVTFINEIATVAEKVGADAGEVERAMRSEPRIGPNAYIRPGAAFAGGTLARDVIFLGEIAGRNDLELHMIGSILESNRRHGGWPARRLVDKLRTVSGRTIAVLGLSYKPGTDATRRSLAVELVRSLCTAGAKVVAYDPKVTHLPEQPPGFVLATSVAEALSGADAMVVMTEWPEFKSISADEIVSNMATPLIVDQNGFLIHLTANPHISFLTIGKPL